MNDNLNSTLINFKKYINPTPGNNKKYNGTIKLYIIIYKKYINLKKSPIIEPKLYTYYIYKNKLIIEGPKHELRRRL